MDAKAASKTVEAEYNKDTDYTKIIWQDPPKEEKVRDDEGDIDGSGGPDIEPVDKYLQEIPSNYDDILDSSIEVNLDDIYNLGKRAMDSARRRKEQIE